jgi:hypothetical protein
MRSRYQELSAGQPVVQATESRDQVPPPSNVSYRIGRVFDPGNPSCTLATQLILRGGISETGMPWSANLGALLEFDGKHII